MILKNYETSHCVVYFSQRTEKILDERLGFLGDDIVRRKI